LSGVTQGTLGGLWCDAVYHNHPVKSTLGDGGVPPRCGAPWPLVVSSNGLC